MKELFKQDDAVYFSDQMLGKRIIYLQKIRYSEIKEQTLFLKLSFLQSYQIEKLTKLPNNI
ncbi:unnamed protein product [Paramecium sonneborni]|uniref:Uncharacterized protein n=1 Tax=Paramecium sonneborni TaxID=65129 RepID=A0A8S1P7Q7_9CILI|nr:unnamed protein product [Paramecium sonneborni]